MSHCILVVDDEPDLEQLIKQKFRKQVSQKEFEFVTAFNGVEALNKLEENQEIDLVLTDINMPQMDGLTLLKKIRELERPELRTIIISAYGDMKNIRSAMNLGAFDFITKPIDFSDLSITIQKTLADVYYLKQAQEIEKKYSSIQLELEIAHKIQQSILPQNNLPLKYTALFDLAARLIPAKEVGGDFYDYFMIDENHLGFSIGDVSGKGIPAAIFMAVCKTALKSIAIKGSPANECFSALNNTLVQESPMNVFATAFYGVLNIQTGELEYGNAGHTPAYLVKPTGEVTSLTPPSGIPLGYRKDFSYGMHHLILQEGDTLFLYTDGVDEAMDKNENEFSQQRLVESLMQNSALPLSALNQSVIDHIHQFTNGYSQSDDITLLSVRFK